MKWFTSTPYLLRLSILGLILITLNVFVLKSHFERERERILDSALTHETDTLRLTLNSITEFYKQLSEGYFKAYIQSQDIFAQFPNLSATNEDIALHERLKFHKHNQALFATLKGKGFDHFTLFTPEGRVLYRAHFPERAGERVIDIPIFKTIAKTKEPWHGFILGTTSAGYKNLYPLFKNNQHIATAEFSISFDSLLQKLSQNHPENEFFLIFRHSARLERLMRYVPLKHLSTPFDAYWLLVERLSSADNIEDSLDMITELKYEKRPDLAKFAPSAIVGTNPQGKHALTTFMPIARTGSIKSFAQLVMISYNERVEELIAQQKNLWSMVGIIVIFLIISVIWFFYNKGQKERRQRYWELISTKMRDGLFLLDHRGRLTYVNPKMCEMLGYSQKELLSHGSPELFLAHALNRRLRDAPSPIISILKSETPYEGQDCFKRKDGSNFSVFLSADLLKISGEKPSVVVIFRDISERIRFEGLMEAQHNLSERLEAIADNLLGFFFEYSATKHEFTYVSAGIKTLLGLKARDVERNAALLWARLEEKSRLNLRESVLQEKSTSISAPNNRYRILGTNGEYVWVEVNAILKDEHGVRRWYGYVRDITEQHLAEESIKESEQRWQFALESAGDGIWDWNVSTNHLFLSPRAHEILGFRVGDLGEHSEDFFALVYDEDKEDTLKRLFGFVEECDSRKVQYISEHRMKKQDGSLCWILVRGMVISRNKEGEAQRIIGTFTDITRRKQIEKNLSDFNEKLENRIEEELAKRIKAEDSFRILFECSPEGFLILDPQGVILELNHAAAQMIGYEIKELKGAGIFTHCKNPHAPLEENQKLTQEEIIYLHHLGHEVIIETIFAPANMEKERRIFALWRDVTEVRRLAFERKKEQTCLMQQAKQAELGSMIGAISHQWKQPLNTLAILIQNLRMDLGEEVIERERIGQECGKMLEMIDFMIKTMGDFRNFFKPSKEKEYFSLYHAISSVFNLFRSEYTRAGISFEIEHKEEIRVYGYGSEFKQVVLNILNNARDVFVERAIKKGKITVEIASENNQACIRFLDNGGGIAPHLLPSKIFEHFNSTKGEGGMGIGLALARTIVQEKMGGSLKAYNSLEGAVFEIILPTNPPANPDTKGGLPS